MEQINAFTFTKSLAAIAVGQIFEGIQRDGLEIKTVGVTQGLMSAGDVGHNEATHSFCFYFENKDEDVMFFISANAEKKDDGALFLNITFNAEDKASRNYMDAKKVAEDHVTKDDKGTTRKTITYSFSFKKSDLSKEIFKNIKGAL